MDATEILIERLNAIPASDIMQEAAECIKEVRAQAQYEADVAEAALEKARELCAEKAGLEHIIAAQAAEIVRLRDLLDEAYAELVADSYRDGPRCLLLTRIEAALAAPAPASKPILYQHSDGRYGLSLHGRPAAFEAYFKQRHNLHPDTDLVHRSDAFEPYKAWQAAIARAKISTVVDEAQIILPQRPEPDALADAVGLGWDAYSGMKMLAYGRKCADAGWQAAVAHERQRQQHVQLGYTLSDVHDAYSRGKAAHQCGEPLTDTFVQTVPDKCDRIVWRGSYYALPPQSAEPMGGEEIHVNCACGVFTVPIQCTGLPDGPRFVAHVPNSVDCDHCGGTGDVSGEYPGVACPACNGTGKPQPAESVKDELPERDSRPTEQQGLFRKFEVRRTDGSDRRGGKHYGCRYFVLDVDHDQYAQAALTAYAAACEATHPKLARDLREKWGAAEPVKDEPSGDWRRMVDEIANNIGEALCASDNQLLVDDITVYVNQLFELSRYQGAQPAASAKAKGPSS